MTLKLYKNTPATFGLQKKKFGSGETLGLFTGNKGGHRPTGNLLI